MSFLNELKRRNVLRLAAAYLVVAWLIIQVVETIFPIYGFSNASIRMVITILAVGLIPTLIFAWVFELTPEGLKRESEVNRSRSITPNTGKKLDRLIMVVLALGLGYFAFDKFALNPQREAAVQEQAVAQVEQARREGRTEGRVESYGDQSIAVLAFDDMSPEGDQEYLADGIAEELLNLLAKIPELRVISRSSAFSFKGQNLELTEIAERLNVAHILEGSVRKAGNRVRITAQLIEARSDTHLWSETYDRQLDDIFAIQDDIAATVVEQLKITLLGQVPHAKEVNPEAYSLYLQARYLRRQGSIESFEESLSLYQQALAIEPDYPAAWTELAAVYWNLANSGQLPATEGLAQGREAVERALAIDPDYALAHAVLGSFVGPDLAQAARYYERALELDPVNIDIIGNAADLLYSLGRLDEAITLQEYVTARDPVKPGGHANLGISYLSAGRWDAANASLQTALRLSPDAIGAHLLIGTALLFEGNTEAALAEMAQESFEAGRLIGLAIARHALGDTPAADSALAELIEKYAQDGAYNIAEVLAFRNETDRAFEWLEKAVEYADTGLSGIVVDPVLANLHDDPRWLPFLESIGKSPEQLAAIKLKVTLPQ